MFNLDIAQVVLYRKCVTYGSTNKLWLVLENFRMRLSILDIKFWKEKAYFTILIEENANMFFVGKRW